MKQKMARNKEEAMALLKEKVILRTRNYKVKVSVGIKRVWKKLTAILETGPGTNLLRECCVPRSLSKHAATMEATHVQSTANRQTRSKKEDAPGSLVWIKKYLNANF